MNRVFGSSLPNAAHFPLLNVCAGKSGFVREPTSWLTSHPDLADTLEKWRGTGSGVEQDRHVLVKNRLTSARYPVELLEYFLGVTREDLGGNEELSDVATFSTGPSPHEDCLAEDTFVDDVRGGVLETERVKTRGSRGMGARPS